MAVSRTVIAAYKRCYNQAELEIALKQALNDRATGVLVTQINFQDGGGSGQVIQGDPNEIIEILEICLQELDSPETSGQFKPLSARTTFRLRRSET